MIDLNKNFNDNRSITSPQQWLVAALVLILTGCAQTGGNVPGADTNAESHYRSAKSKLDKRDFLGAVEAFESLEARFPFGEFTQQAQLDVAYAYYKLDEFDNAIDAAERYIKLYPTSENIDYAWYIKGLSNFSRGSSALERLFPRDMAKVDQNWLRASYADFNTLVQRFPDSTYVEDASERLRYLYNQMARHELLAARFYFQRGAMVATINRVNYLLSHFERSTHVNDALVLMAEAYGKSGQDRLQQDTLRVLALNAPDHPAITK